MFDAPIPGQSLTNEPKNYPWENPTRLNSPEDALVFHMERLEEPRRIKAALDFLQMDMTVVTLVEGILRSGVANGEHSIDVSMLIAPVIHEHIVSLAKVARIDFDEGLEDEDEMSDEDSKYATRTMKARKILKQIKRDEEPELDDLEASMPDVSLQEEEPKMAKQMPEEKPAGLMARPQGVM